MRQARTFSAESAPAKPFPDGGIAGADGKPIAPTKSRNTSTFLANLTKEAPLRPPNVPDAGGQWRLTDSAQGPHNFYPAKCLKSRHK